MSLIELAKEMGIDPRKLLKGLITSFDSKTQTSYVDMAKDDQVEAMLNIHKETIESEQLELKKTKIN